MQNVISENSSKWLSIECFDIMMAVTLKGLLHTKVSIFSLITCPKCRSKPVEA